MLFDFLRRLIGRQTAKDAKERARFDQCVSRPLRVRYIFALISVAALMLLAQGLVQ